MFESIKYPELPIEDGDKVILKSASKGDNFLRGCRAVVSNIYNDKADIVVVDDLVHNGLKQNSWPISEMILFQKKIKNA